MERIWREGTQGPSESRLGVWALSHKWQEPGRVCSGGIWGKICFKNNPKVGSGGARLLSRHSGDRGGSL